MSSDKKIITYFAGGKTRVRNGQLAGKVLLRLDPDLLRRITIEARKQDLSLNQWLNQVLEKATA